MFLSRMRLKKFFVTGGVKLDHGAGARIDHFLGRRKLIVAFSAATHSFKPKPGRRGEPQKSRHRMPVSPAHLAMHRFRKALNSLTSSCSFLPLWLHLVELQRYGPLNDFAHLH